MIRHALATYIREQLDQGIPWSEVNNILVAKGWREEDIVDSFDSMQSTKITELEREEKVPINVTKIVFHAFVILIIISVVAGGVITILSFSGKTEVASDTSVPAILK